LVLFVFNGILAITEPTAEVHKTNPDTVFIDIDRQSSKLQFCARGTIADRVRSSRIKIGGAISPVTEDNLYRLPTGDNLGRFALPHADHIDWVFIVKMIFSLFAIIFTFDAISWERENGTLKLICANSVSRSSILIGKYLGACGTVMIPLAVGLIVNLIIIMVLGGVIGNLSLDSSYGARIILLITTSFLYISLFILLGLLVSTWVQRSSSSLLILLAFWVVLVIVIPNLAGIIAEHTVKTESEYQISKKRRQIWNTGELDKSKIDTQEDLDRVMEENFLKMIKLINKTASDHQNALVEKRRTARRIAMISPAAIYQFLSESMADSGFERQQGFMKNLRDYYPVYENYVREKVGKIIPWSGWSFSMTITIKDKPMGAMSPAPEHYKGDMSDFPYFSEPRWSVTDSLRVSLNNFAILFLWNILLFISAHYIFVKRSLR
jgi:ABC-type transport system involved in multi-copper enzyme maturation permease subunit